MVKILRYNQTKLNILHQIAKLGLQVGDLLPSERNMAAKLGISMGTLRRALAELEAQSIIQKQHGRGSILKKSIKQGKKRSRLALIHIQRPERQEILPNVDKLNVYLNNQAIDLEYIPVISFDAGLIPIIEKCFCVLVTGWLTKEWIENLQLLNKPMLAIGSHKYSELLPFVSYDWKGAGALLTRELITSKAKRIGLLNGSHRYHPASLIYDGYTEELSRAGLELNDNWVKWVPIDDDHEIIKNFIINQLSELDAVVVEYGCYLPFLSLCWGMGIVPDKKLAVTGVYGQNNSHIVSHQDNVSWAVFEEDLFIVGAEFFLASLQNKTSFQREHVITAKLV